MKRSPQWIVTTVFVLLGFSISSVSAQVSLAKQEMQKLYKSYDSLQYLTFDVQFEYATDTIFGHHSYDLVNGTYTMNGKKAFYKIGDITFVQNDNILIGIYERDKVMILGEPQQKSAGGFLPMRNQIDSILNAASQHYTINVFQNLGSSKTDTSFIELVRADSLAEFDKFRIVYTNNHTVTSVNYDYSGYPDNPSEFDDMSDGQKNLLNVIRKKHFTIRFSRYRYANSDKNIYETNSYIFWEDNEYKPVSKYADYKIYNASVKR